VNEGSVEMKVVYGPANPLRVFLAFIKKNRQKYRKPPAGKSRAECCGVEWRGSQQWPVNKAIIIINVIGTPMIQSNIERIMVSFMSCSKIICLLPYQLLTS
jgi:hypothetical protein